MPTGISCGKIRHHLKASVFASRTCNTHKEGAFHPLFACRILQFIFIALLNARMNYFSLMEPGG